MKKSTVLASYHLVSAILLLIITASGCSGNNGIALIDTGLMSTLEKTLDTYLDANVKDSQARMTILVVEKSHILYANSRIHVKYQQ